MEHSYLTSISVLKEVLRPLGTKDARYHLVAGRDAVTVIHYGPTGLIRQVAFPVVYRIEDVPEDEGTLLLMVATERSREWDNFWSPIEAKLPQATENMPA